MKVAVVGGGVMGCSAAYRVAERGHQVTLYEQFEIAHKRGSSHGASRIYRYSYPDPTYVEMMKETLPLWHELERATGRELLTNTGGLDAGASLDRHFSALDACGIEFESMDGRQANERWPVLLLPEDDEVLFQKDGGFVHAERAWRTFAELAASSGAEVRSDSRVAGIEIDGSVMVRTDRVERFDAVVVTAGGWARGLLAGVGIDLPVRPTRETVVFFEMRGVPPTLVDWGDPAVYSLPDPGRGLKAGEHIAGPVTDADAEGEVDRALVDRLTEWVARRFPHAASEPWNTETCIYTNTEDEGFLIERHGQIVVGSACSGHGFKFAPLVGQRLAALVEEI